MIRSRREISGEMDAHPQRLPILSRELRIDGPA
jgi:hypothetical protein